MLKADCGSEDGVNLASYNCLSMKWGVTLFYNAMRNRVANGVQPLGCPKATVTTYSRIEVRF